MADEVPPAPQPEPPPPPEVRKARRKVQLRRSETSSTVKTSAGNFVAGALCITTAAGIAFAIAVPGLLSSQGARYSVRIEWKRRDAELDALAEQARKDGKLPPAPEARRGD